MSDADVHLVTMINPLLKRLSNRRVDRIGGEDFVQSKLAWKVATYAQGILYRIAMLANGCALNWNADNHLCAILAARALMETCVLIWDVERQIKSCLERKALPELNDIIDKQSSATRNPAWLTSEWRPSFSEATNIITVIKRVEENEGMKGLLQEYYRLSERCHPNSEGHLFLFGTLDRTTATYNYSDTKRHTVSLNAVLHACLLAGIAEHALGRLDDDVTKISELQHGAA